MKRSLSAAVGGLVEEELSDELFEHDRRLRLRYRAAVGEDLRVAASVETDIDLPQQPRRENRSDGIGGELEAAIDPQRDDGLIAFRIELDPLDTPDDHAGRLHGRLQLESP